MTCTRQMAQVSHSTSQLHMATAFHFFSENILSAPPALAPEEPECEVIMPGSSPSSTSAMAVGGRRRWRRRLGCPARLLRRSSGPPQRQPEESQTTERATWSPATGQSFALKRQGFKGALNVAAWGLYEIKLAFLNYGDTDVDLRRYRGLFN